MACLAQERGPSWSVGTAREDALRNIRDAIALYLEPEVDKAPAGAELELVS